MSMRSVKTVATVASIYKIKSTKTVRFALPTNLRQIFSDYKNGINPQRYTDLVCAIRDCPVDDNSLQQLLKDAEYCISILDYDLRHFVEALVILDWNRRADDVVVSYRSFMVALASAHIQYADMIVKKFIPLFGSCETDCQDEELTSDPLRMYENVHSIFRSLLKTVPLIDEKIVKYLGDNFPYSKNSSATHLTYIANCLKVLDYLPQYRFDILQILVGKLIDLDASIDSSDHTIEDPLLMADDVQTKIDSLDYGMLLLFQYIDGVCRPNGTDVLADQTVALFKDLIVIMKESILPVKGISHVQFILFYICSIYKPLSKSYLKSLWELVLDPSEPARFRSYAVFHIASFLARAAFATPDDLRTYLEEMTNWVGRYIADHDQCFVSTNSHDVHLLFYSMCQAIFYLIAFRRKHLFESRASLMFLNRLHLDKIINCSLNPLAICSVVVVENFAEVTREHEIWYCYSIIERNNRFLRSIKQIDDFFPYDPYMLKRSSGSITPSYREYQRGPSRPSNSTENDGNCVEMEDDFINERAMPVPSRKPEFNYSLSPGFKMSV